MQPTAATPLDTAPADYDEILTEGTIRIGVLMGSEAVLYVKTGQGGTIYGQDNHFLRMAEMVRERYGLSVFVSATENDRKEVFQTEMEWLRERIPNPHSPIYCFGYSKGGLITCWHGVEEPRVRRILTVNAPLMVNFHNRTVPALRTMAQRWPSDGMTMVYGTLDPSYPFVPFLQNRARVEILEGTDHNMVGSPLSFFDMVERWLLFDVPRV